MRYVFGDCTLDTERFELWRAGTLVKLRPKVFDVLAYLLAHRERVVSKQELLEQLWPKQFVGEATLNSCIQAARLAVGDTGQAQRVIHTLHGRGYRFVADVEGHGHTLSESARPLSPTMASQLQPQGSPVAHGSGMVPDDPDILCFMCQHRQRAEAVFCMACGTRLLQVCPNCGEAVRLPATDCTACGHVLEAVSSSQERSLVTSLTAPLAESERLTPHGLEAEHKPVTVLSCGLAEATTVAARLGAEAMHRLMQTFFATAQQVMQRYGGTLTHVAGDGFLALFGAPMAQEDHARRAVLAAVELYQTWQERQEGEGLNVPLCSGVHTGEVVVGGLGEDAQRLYTAVGETIDLASRLRQLAAPGAILISATTQQLVQDEVQVDDGGTVNAAETTAAMPVYIVRRIAQRRAGVPGRRGRAWSRFVGRARELATLHERLAYSADGEGQVIGIAGEPGIGKSRLLFEFRQSLSGRPVRYYEGHCLAYGSATPYLPVRDLLRQICGITEADGPEAIAAKVQRAVQEAGVTSAEEPLLLFQLLDLPLQGERIAQLSPPARRSRTFALLRQVFVHYSQHQPLVLAVENAHWIDATSEAWLTTLAERLPSAAILLLVTYRPGYHPSWLGQSAATQMALPRLTPRDSLTVVQSILPTKPLPEAVRQEMVSKAAGNPFFLEELAWAIREHDAPHAPLRLPPTVQAVLAARLDRLPAAEKALVQTAAVIGTDVPLPLLQAVSGLSEDIIQAPLGRLQTDEFVYETRLVPVSVYTFKHVLIQEVAYNSLLSTRRIQLHRAIGQAMEALYQERLAERYEELAHHFTQGEAWEKAFVYLYQAGEKARQAYANPEAIAFYTRALDVSSRVTPPLVAMQLLPVYEGRGLVRMLQTKYEEASADFQQMRQMARASGNQQKEGESLCHLAYAHWVTFSPAQLPFVEQYAGEALGLAQRTGDHKVLAKSLNSLGFIDVWRGHLWEAERKLHESLRICQREGYKDALAQAQMFLGAKAYWQGDFQRAIHVCQEAVAGARDMHDGFHELFTLAFLCLAHWSAGAYTQAFTMVHAGMKKAREWENTFILGRLTNTLGWFYSEFGDISRALEYDHESMELGRTSGISNVEISALINLGLDYLALGQHERARLYLEPTLERVEREASGAHRWRWKIRLLIGLAEFAYASGAFGDALRYVEAGLQEAQATSSQKYLAKGWALRGKLLTKLGHAKMAGTELQRALAVAESLHSPSLLYPIAYDLGQWYETVGEERKAAALYSTAKASIEQMATAVEDEALRTTLRRSALVHTSPARVAHIST